MQSVYCLLKINVAIHQNFIIFCLCFLFFAKEHGDLLGACPEDEVLSPGDECMESVLDESFLETCPIQSPLQVFAGMGGLALIAERLPMLYPDVIQQVRLGSQIIAPFILFRNFKNEQSERFNN